MWRGRDSKSHSCEPDSTITTTAGVLPLPHPTPSPTVSIHLSQFVVDSSEIVPGAQRDTLSENRVLTPGDYIPQRD